jgi:hypothetical protein
MESMDEPGMGNRHLEETTAMEERSQTQKGLRMMDPAKSIILETKAEKPPSTRYTRGLGLMIAISATWRSRVAVAPDPSVALNTRGTGLGLCNLKTWFLGSSATLGLSASCHSLRDDIFVHTPSKCAFAGGCEDGPAEEAA